MAFVRIDHINLTCPKECEDAVLAFYRDGLGLPQLEKPSGRRSAGGWFDLGMATLHISVDPVLVAEQSANPRHIAFVVDDLASVERSVGDAGGKLLDDPRPPTSGRRRFVLDPAGNRLELIEPEAP